MRRQRHHEHHLSHRSGWLRAAVLGANDGIVSTASLVLGVASAQGGASAVLLAGVASLVAGAMSMAAGEYVSVSSQSDIEQADMEQERRELLSNLDAERRELAGIYVSRGLAPALATQVADQLMKHDALGAHARDELGITEQLSARPLQAAVTSAGCFSAGAAVPLVAAVVMLWVQPGAVTPVVAGVSLATLALLGVIAARTGGAPVLRGALRVTLWGAAAMAVTSAVGALVGHSV
jgi:VIT1/CCC1 family predicted Fe2+/Mn2+ transporter